jgi:hypothetical protein
VAWVGGAWQVRGVKVSGPDGTGAGMQALGDKNNSFLAETLPKLRFLWSFHIFSHHIT